MGDNLVHPCCTYASASGGRNGYSIPRASVTSPTIEAYSTPGPGWCMLRRSAPSGRVATISEPPTPLTRLERGHTAGTAHPSLRPRSTSPRAGHRSHVVSVHANPPRIAVLPLQLRIEGALIGIMSGRHFDSNRRPRCGCTAESMWGNQGPTTNTGLLSGSAVSCEPGTTRHWATLETGEDGR